MSLEMQKVRSQGLWKVLGKTLKKLRMMTPRKGRRGGQEEWDKVMESAGDRMNPGLG